ncbi:MAG: c-type cytochrome [Betaproteobacteria bacterium]
MHPLRRSAVPALIAAALALFAGAFMLTAAPHAFAGDRVRVAPGGPIDPASLYHNYCSVCHGDHGNGDSRAKGSLNPPPANFTDPRLQGKLTRDYIAAILHHGKPKTAMVSFTTQLGEAEIAALADYVRRTFVEPSGDAQLARGRALYGHYCSGCHGENDFRRGIGRDRMVAAVAVGRKGTPMAGFAGQLQPEDIEAVVDYVEKGLMATQSAAISGTSAHGGRQRDVR